MHQHPAPSVTPKRDQKTKKFRDNKAQKEFRKKSKSEMKSDKHVAHGLSLEVANAISGSMKGREPTSKLKSALNDDSNFGMVKKNINTNIHTNDDNNSKQYYHRKIDGTIINAFENNEPTMLTKNEANRAKKQVKQIMENDKYPLHFKETAREKYKLLTYYNKSKDREYQIWDQRKESGKLRENRENGKNKEKRKNVEQGKKIEKEKQRERERERERERDLRVRERERQKEKERKRERLAYENELKKQERQRELQRRQKELEKQEKQRLKELERVEKERQREIQRENERQRERERQLRIEMERERERERERQRELEREMARQRQREMERERERSSYSNYESNGSADGRTVYEGPRGGHFYYTQSGNKRYI